MGNEKNPLSPAEERELGRGAHSGDLVAANQLVMANLRLAKSVAGLASCPLHGRRCDELEQAAFVGLCKASRGYDPDGHPGVKFSSYAYPIIQRHVWESCSPRGNVRADSLPADVAEGIPGGPLETPRPEEVPSDVAEARDSLDGIVGYVVRARFPAAGEPARTLREIGEEIGASPQAVARIQRRGLGALRSQLAGRKRGA